jgi:EAL domain-containing protein (putative c-di-GMP-specific phosphodiesterase class I)
VVCGVEALARWAHPEHGLLGPAQFLRVAEEPGLAGEFTARVLQQALRDKAAWTAMGVDWPVTVNVSIRDLERPAFPETVATVLSQHGIDPRGLQIDVTETAVAADSKIVGESVTALAEHGIRIAVGGVGVGHTSVSQLRRLPVTEVKIDRILIKDLARDERDQAIVRSLIELAHGIGLQVTAAGVETAVEADWLTSAGCDYAQGHLYARPAPWPELVRQHTDAVPSTTRPTASTEGTS